MNVIRSKRKTIALSVNAQGEPEVRAPLHCTDAEIARFVARHRAWLNKRLAEYRPPKEYTKEEISALRAAARAYIPARVAYYAAQMGARCGNVKITAAKTRYGSCSPRNNLCFSLFLMEKSPRFIDYVVVHELAHTFQHNHSPAFYREIEKILPDYREIKKRLN